jgi:uncharacterized membrane protein YhaH (DUF805 family)
MISNRIGRLELLFWCVIPILASSLLMVIMTVAVSPTILVPLRYPVNGPFAVVLILVSITILKSAVSRFHDLGWPGWLVLLLFVPLVDIVVFLFLLLMPGQKTPNPYGELPTFLQQLRRKT